MMILLVPICSQSSIFYQIVGMPYNVFKINRVIQIHATVNNNFHQSLRRQTNWLFIILILLILWTKDDVQG